MTKLWNPQELAEVLGVSLLNPNVTGHNTSAPDTEPFRLDDYPSVQAALDHVTVPADRSADHYRVLCACFDAGLTLAQARWAVNQRVDLAGRLGERRDDDVACAECKLVARNRRMSGEPINTDDPVTHDQAVANVVAVLGGRIIAEHGA